MKRIISIGLLACGLLCLYSQMAEAATLPSINIGTEETDDPKKMALVVEILLVFTVLSMAPAILLMTTSFTRLVVAFSFLRHAMGTQQMPPNQVVIGLAIFLTVFITSFYFDDADLLKKLFFFYLAGVIVLTLYFLSGLNEPLSRVVPFPADILVLCFIVAYCVYAWLLIRDNTALRKKYRTSMIVAIAAPFIVGLIFKYFLLVPMPAEGLVVTIMDYFWYLDFLE